MTQSKLAKGERRASACIRRPTAMNSPSPALATNSPISATATTREEDPLKAGEVERQQKQRLAER